MKYDYNKKIKYAGQMIKSKEKQLKVLQDEVNKIVIKN